MRLLWIVAVMLHRRETPALGWIRSGSESISYTQTISWLYCENEDEAYAKAVKYAFNEKPGFSIDQVTVASSDEFALYREYQSLGVELANARRDIITFRQSSNEAWAEVETALAKLHQAKLALKVATVQLFGDHKEDALRTFTLEELAQFTEDAESCQEMRVEDIYREVLLGTPKPQYPSIDEIIELPTEPMIFHDYEIEKSSGNSDVGEDIRGAS